MIDKEESTRLHAILREAREREWEAWLAEAYGDQDFDGPWSRYREWLLGVLP